MDRQALSHTNGRLNIADIKEHNFYSFAEQYTGAILVYCKHAIAKILPVTEGATAPHIAFTEFKTFTVADYTDDFIITYGKKPRLLIKRIQNGTGH